MFYENILTKISHISHTHRRAVFGLTLFLVIGFSGLIYYYVKPATQDVSNVSKGMQDSTAKTAKDISDIVQGPLTNAVNSVNAAGKTLQQAGIEITKTANEIRNPIIQTTNGITEDISSATKYMKNALILTTWIIGWGIITTTSLWAIYLQKNASYSSIGSIALPSYLVISAILFYYMERQALSNRDPASQKSSSIKQSTMA